MYDDPRFDPEMRAAQRAEDAAASRLPPIRLEFSFAPQRAINDALVLLSAAGGPTMAAIEDRWIAARQAPLPRGILGIYPVCDSDLATPSYREFADG